jgi:hypothetical protein
MNSCTRLGLAPSPVLDALHRRALGRELAAPDEQSPERAERMPVLVGVSKAQSLAVLELHLAGSLDVQEEGVDRVVDPDQLASLQRRGIAIDVAAREVGHDAIALELAAQALALQLRVHRREVDHEHVRRRRVQGIAVSGCCAGGCRSTAARNSP